MKPPLGLVGGRLLSDAIRQPRSAMTSVTMPTISPLEELPCPGKDGSVSTFYAEGPISTVVPLMKNPYHETPPLLFSPPFFPLKPVPSYFHINAPLIKNNPSFKATLFLKPFPYFHINKPLVEDNPSFKATPYFHTNDPLIKVHPSFVSL